MARKLSTMWNQHKDLIEERIRIQLKDTDRLRLNHLSALSIVDLLILTLESIRSRLPFHRVDWEFPDPQLMDVKYLDCPRGVHAVITICVPPEHDIPNVKRKGRQWLLQLTYNRNWEYALFTTPRDTRALNDQTARCMKLSQMMVRDLKLVESNLIDLN